MKLHPLDDAPLSGFHKRLALYAAGGPFLDGYILSSIGVALVAAGPELELSTVMKGLIGAGALIGMLFGGAVSGFLTDRFGRQVMFTLDLGLIAAISVSQFFVTEGWMLLVARLFLGACVAADYPMASSLLTEFSPRKYRGQFLSGLVCMFFIGAAAAYFVGDAMLRHLGDDGWRWFLASAAVPALTLLLLRLGTPESPRWLLSRGRGSEAQQVLTRVYGAHVTVADIAQDAGPTSTWRDLLRRGYLGRLVYVVIFYTCSNIPVFAIYTFGPEILGAFGLESISDNIGSAVLEFLFLIGVVTALLVINKTGRRRMVIWGSILAGLALLVLGLAPEASPLVVVTAFTSFAIFNGGPQVLTWVYPNELFPTAIRATAVGIVTALTRVGSAVGVFLVPLSLEHLGIGGTMLIAAAILIFGGVVSIIWAPETTGLSLDEASSIDNGAGGHRPAAQTGQSPLAAKSDRY
ncbi:MULTISPECIES: MFS transporter [Rhodococcus]|uniref:MFS transporter n=1 Tax=Rhodococcus qingshengii JCM 15477 TaxID=1303681 RepID=A0AB38RMA7_RHOSG|nr:MULTISPECIES: MFS transporter [Rhodococcus]MDA3636974.1 MFS transporter [Rhodococcus sp. C-2]UPU46530.1 MFS transporter [Rhodococcus qingshengii JCM 15477]